MGRVGVDPHVAGGVLIVTWLQPGDSIDYVVTWMEMTAPPSYARPALPVGNDDIALLRVQRRSTDFFLFLYEGVGRPYEWTDQLRRPRAELEAWLTSPGLETHVLYVGGAPGGFFMLDLNTPGVCDLAYFGLFPDVTGRGLGRWLLGTAIHEGWSRKGVARMTVNTNSLDHPAALPLYQSMGFRPFDRTHARRVLAQPRQINGSGAGAAG